jgi:hypothetical protein
MFRPPSWTAGEVWSHWVWPEEGPIAAAGSGRIDLTGSYHLYVMSSPEARGQAEAALVEAALREEQPRSAGVVVETDEGPAERGLEGLGFASEHRLTWMGLDVRDRVEGSR